jgi:hypothetical protein
MPDKIAKVTVLMPVEAVRMLDDIVKVDLRGSRGRAIEALVRLYWKPGFRE